MQAGSDVGDARRSLVDRVRATPGWSLFAFALCLRLLWLAALLASADELVAFPAVDGAFYHQWARDILANGELATAPFFAHPLYPHLIAGLYAVFGVEPLWVALSQSVLGALSCVLLARLCLRFFDPAVAWLAGCGLAVFWPAVANVALLETVELGNFLLLGSLTLWTSGAAAWRSVLAGACLGAATLCRANLVAMSAPLLLVLVQTPTWRVRIGRAVALAAGVAVVIVAVGVRNRVVSGQWLFTSGHAGVTFYSGFAPGNFTGTYQAPAFVRPEPRFEQRDFQAEAERRSSRALTTAEASQYWRDRALQSIANDLPGAGLRMLRKFRLVLAAHEVADNNNLAYLKRLTAFHYVPLPAWGALLALCTLGLVTCWSRRRSLAWLYGCVAVYVSTLLIFFVSSRLRAPLWPLLMPFAAHGVLALATWVRGRQWRQVVLGLAGVGAVAAGAHMLTPAELARADLSQAIGNHAHALMQAGKLSAAQQKQAAALTTDPANPYLLVNGGQLALRLGKPDEALALCGRAIEHNPLLATAHACLGVSRAELGDLKTAVSDLRRSVALDPSAVAARLNLAIVLGRSGAAAEARALMRELARVAPDDTAVKAALQVLHAQP